MCALLENDKANAIAKSAETAAADLATAKAEWEALARVKITEQLEQAEEAKRNAVRNMEEDAEVSA